MMKSAHPGNTALQLVVHQGLHVSAYDEKVSQEGSMKHAESI